MKMTSGEIYQKIEDAIYDFRMDPDDIVNPVEMASHYGVATVYADFSGYDKLKDKLGYYRIDVIDGNNGKAKEYKHTICCREDIGKKWLSFVLAHELAHFFIYKNGIMKLPDVSTIVDAFPVGSSTDNREIACNLFAREMLMPEGKYRKGVDFYSMRGIAEEKRIVKYLASDFVVPFEHAWKRGVDLGVFSNEE